MICLKVLPPLLIGSLLYLVPLLERLQGWLCSSLPGVAHSSSLGQLESAVPCHSVCVVGHPHSLPGHDF